VLDIVWRLDADNTRTHPSVAILVLSLLITSETDVMPGDHGTRSLPRVVPRGVRH